MTTYKINIIGKVQGVWYRASAKDKAISLGITGKIWNEVDGNVGAIAQGPEEQIMQFIKWCKQGPPLAKVESVEYKEINDPVVYKTFEISRSISRREK